MPAAADPHAAPRVDALREFNRFYTRRIGVLHEGLLASEFTLTQSRLLWELAQRGSATASELSRALDLDAGYLSRLLGGFRERGLIRTTPAADDARQRRLALTPAGRKAFAPLDERSRRDTGALLAALPDAQQQELLQALATVRRLLGAPRVGLRPARPPQGSRKPGAARRFVDSDDAAPTVSPAYTLRAHRAGDIGWVVSRHGALYAQEYGWDMSFEALVGHIASRFIEQFDAAREACWIAESAGARVGCVFLVQARDETTNEPDTGVAQLRMLLVEPQARGHRLGAALVAECERFARQAGYRAIRLWTNSILVAARGIYQKAGYTLVASEAHHSFGHDLVGETWELRLR